MPPVMPRLLGKPSPVWVPKTSCLPSSGRSRCFAAALKSFLRQDPDVIMVGDINFGGMDGRPGWDKLRAIKAKHVCIFNPTESEMLVRPGPRMADGARLMAQCLQRVLR